MCRLFVDCYGSIYLTTVMKKTGCEAIHDAWLPVAEVLLEEGYAFQKGKANFLRFFLLKSYSRLKKIWDLMGEFEI